MAAENHGDAEAMGQALEQTPHKLLMNICADLSRISNAADMSITGFLFPIPLSCSFRREG